MKKLSLLVIVSIICFGCPSKDEPETINPAENVALSITTPSLNQSLNNNIEYELKSETSSQVKKIEYFIDGVSVGSVISPPYILKWTPKDVDGGQHSITAIAISSQNNEFKFESKFQIELLLGDEFKGGKIFYLNADRKSGLIAAKENLKDKNGMEKFFWGNAVLIGTTKDNGQENTKKIALAADAYYLIGFPFKDGLSYNGYKDWYIPSVNELDQLNTNKSYVGGFPTSSSDALFWSSTESSDKVAFGQNFVALQGNAYTKGGFYGRVRPIRKF